MLEPQADPPSDPIDVQVQNLRVNFHDLCDGPLTKMTLAQVRLDDRVKSIEIDRANGMPRLADLERGMVDRHTEIDTLRAVVDRLQERSRRRGRWFAWIVLSLSLWLLALTRIYDWAR